MSIVLCHETINVLDEVCDASKGAAANGFLGNDIEPDFYLIQLGGVCRGVVNMIPRSGTKPSPNPRVFMGSVIVHDQMDVQILWDSDVDEI